MELELVCVGRDGVRRAVIIEVEPDQRVGELARLLGCRELYSGPAAIPNWLALRGSDIVNGTVLGMEAPLPVQAGAAVGGGTHEVAVVGGLHGGPRTTLYPMGTMAVGRASDADLVLADVEVSRRHVRLVVAGEEDCVQVEDVGSHNGTRWCGRLIREAVELAAGDVVELGETVIGLREAVDADAEPTRVPECGHVLFHRPSERMTPTLSGTERSERLRDPDPSWLLSTACAPSSRLWERRADDPDFMRLRLGLQDRPAEPWTPIGTTPVLYAVPVTVDLAQVGVLGLAGPRSALLAWTRAVVAQAAVLRGPDDLATVLITDAEGAAVWDWFGWLPHARPRSAAFDCSRLVATDLPQARARLGELRELLLRQQDRPCGVRPRVLVVLDGVQRLHGVPGLTELLTSGPNLGVVTLCMEQDARALPPACGAVLSATNDIGSRAELHGRSVLTVPDVLVDGLLAEHATQLALALAPVVLSGECKPVHRQTKRRVVQPRLMTDLGRPTEKAAPSEADRTSPVVTAALGLVFDTSVLPRNPNYSRVSGPARGSVVR